MRGITRKLEWSAMGGVLRRVEWGGAYKRSKITRQGEKLQIDDDHMGSGGNMCGKRDQAGFTEHQFGADGWAGGGTLRATAMNVDVGFLQETS